MAVISDIEIRLRADIARLRQDMNAVRRTVDGAMGGVTRAALAARNALAGITAGIGLSELARLTDGYTKYTAQLKLATDSQEQYNRALADVKRISNTAQNDIGATGVLYARIIGSTKALGVSQSQVAKVTETVNLALAAGAAGASEASSAMLQLSQAFGSGVLRGEEFNAVYEAAPELLRVLASSIGIPIGALRKMAEEGKLTSDVLIKAFSDDKVIERLRGNVAEITTFSGALQVFKNNLMEVVGQQAHASGAVKGLTTAILAAAGAIGSLSAVLGPALKIGAAYVAAFVIAPPLFAAAATAMGNFRLQLALARLEMAGGATAASLLSKAFGGVSISAALASGALTRLTLATNVLFAAFAGWQIGQYLNDQFVEVEIAGEIMAGGLLEGWERIKFGAKVAFDGMTVFAREAISTMASGFAKWFEFVAKGLRMIGDDRSADALAAYADKIRTATAVQGTFAGRTAEARAEMEKNIKVIDQDTDRRIASAYAASREGVKLTEASKAAAAGGKTTKVLTEEQKKALAVYNDLIRSLQERVDETAREVAGLAALTTAEKAHLDLTQQLADGKLKLSTEQERAARSLIDEAGANDVLIKSNKEWQELQQQLVDNSVELTRERAALIQSARDEAEQNEFLVETFGMAEAAVIRLRAARLLEQEAQRLGRDLNDEEITDLQRVIELKERSAKAVAKREELEKSKQFWTDIEKTARDTFVSIADGGKNAFQRLKDTAKNTFFDWLYQQTLKKWIVNIQTSTSGGSLLDTFSKGGFSGLYEAGKTMLQGFSQGVSTTLGNAISKLGTTFGSKAATTFGSNIASSASAGGIAGAVVAGMMANNKFYSEGWRLGGQASDIIKSQLGSMLKGNGLAPITAIMTASMSSFEKLLGAIGVNNKFASLLSGSAVFARAFGRKAPTVEGQGIQGTITANSVNIQSFAEILEKGGWFRSDKRYTRTAALDATQSQGFNDTLAGMAGSVRAFGKIIGAETGVLDRYSKQVKITFGKDEAANQKMIADLFESIGNELATTLVPNIMQFAQAGETAAATLQRVSINFAAVDDILAAMGTDSQTAFRAVGVASIEARERLVALAGGVEALASQTSFFNSNFLSQAEQIALIQKPLREQLAQLGYAGVTTADQFRDAVVNLANSGRLATEEGARTYAGLLALAPAFKTVTEYLKGIDEAAKKLLADRADSAFDDLGRAVDAQKEIVSKAFTEAMDALDTGIDSVNGSISRTRELSQQLKSALSVVESPAQNAGSRQAAKAQVMAAIAIAKASGVLPTAEDLEGALSTLRLDSSGQFSTLADYQREVARTNAQLQDLGGLTDAQLTIAERQLKAMQDQRAQMIAANDAELLRLDGIVSFAQLQLNAANGIDTRILSVIEAQERTRQAILALSNSTGYTVPSAPPDVINPTIQTSTTGTIVSMQAVDYLQSMDQRLTNMEISMRSTASSTGQTARQIDQISGGGNALLVENTR